MLSHLQNRLHLVINAPHILGRLGSFDENYPFETKAAEGIGRIRRVNARKRPQTLSTRLSLHI
jgi:hypothetical protein